MSAQSMEALRLADETRFARADLKRRLREDEADLADLLRRPLPPWLENETLGHLLLALPHLGKYGADRILIAVDSLRILDRANTLGELTPREREGLADSLDERYYRR